LSHIQTMLEKKNWNSNCSFELADKVDIFLGFPLAFERTLFTNCHRVASLL
jgi:hypothetical protein